MMSQSRHRDEKKSDGERGGRKVILEKIFSNIFMNGVTGVTKAKLLKKFYLFTYLNYK